VGAAALPVEKGEGLNEPRVTRPWVRGKVPYKSRKKGTKKRGVSVLQGGSRE